MAQKHNVLWSPQPGPQTEFATRPEFEVLYGGAKGGGKSDVLLMEGLRQINNPRYHAGFFRRTYPRLQEMIDRSQEYFPKLGAKWKGQEHRWVFPSGARYDFRHIQNEEDKYNYNGQEFHYMAFDQIEEFTESMYDYMIMQIRTSDPTIRTYTRSSANPGGVGHAWVKRRWIEGKIPGKKYIKEFVLPDGRTITMDSCFIPAKVHDNKILIEANPLYLAQLMSMPDKLRKAMLDGDWDVFEGQVFMEWNRDTHVIKPRMPKKNYLCYRSLDWGYSRPFSVGWWYIDEDGNAVRYRELYGCTGVPDEGLKLEPYTVGQMIANMETPDEDMVYGIADSACWSTDDGGEPVISLINKALLEKDLVPFNRQADKRKGSRVAGKMQLHYRLKNSLINKANGIYICENCVDFIRTIPMLIYDEKKVEDVNTSQEDHAFDEARYFLDSKPVTPDPIKEDTRRYPEEDFEDYREDGSWFD